MKFLFKYATRDRPNWFKKTLLAYKSKLSGSHEYEFIITCNTDDKTMNNLEMRKFMKQQRLSYHFGDHKTKIEAINANMENCDFDILVVISDDMNPIVKDFDIIMAQDMNRYFPDLDGTLHYNDGGHCGMTVISFTVIGKKLYDKFGCIYYHEYKSFYCDNEFTDIVRQIGKVQWIDNCLINHTWDGTLVKGDALYKRNSFPYHEDMVLFYERRKLGYPNALVSKFQGVLKPFFIIGKPRKAILRSKKKIRRRL